MSEEIQYDVFPPFCKLKMEGFSFPFNHVEIWQDGAKIDELGFKGLIQCEIINAESEQIARISILCPIVIFTAHLTQYLKLVSDYDALITGDHRLQYIRIPEKTNTTCIGLSMMQILIGPTIPEKNFELNEPYCCNVFLKNQRVAKVSFSLCNPERLIEFTYQIISVPLKWDELNN